MKKNFGSYLNLKSILSFSGINYAQAGLGFLVTILLAKYLGKEDYGYYTYGLVFLNSVFVLASFGMDKSLVRDLVQAGGQFKDRMISATYFKAGLGFLMASGIVLWAVFALEEDMTKLTIVGLCCLGGVFMASSPKAWYDVKGLIHQHARITFTERLSFFLVAGSIAYFFSGVQAVMWVVVALVLIKFIFLGVEWTKIKNEFSDLNHKFSEWLPKILKNNTWIWLAAIGNLFMAQFNQLVLEGASGLKQLAAFGLAFQLVHFIRLLQNQILRLAAPKIAAISSLSNSTVILNNLLKTGGLSLGATLILVIPFYLFAPFFIQEVIGKDFSDSIPVFNVLLIWILFYGVALINNQFLIGLHLQRSYFATSLVFGLISIFLAYYFIGLYGAKGAAMSLLIAHGASVLTQVFIVLNHLYRNEKYIQTTH